MNISDILEHYESLSDEILTLLKEERVFLKDSQSTDELHGRKRELIDQLTKMVAQVKAYRESTSEDLSPFRERFAYVQQRLMKILQLDRDVEKLFLGNSARPKVPDLVPAASRVGQAYQAAVTVHV